MMQLFVILASLLLIIDGVTGKVQFLFAPFGQDFRGWACPAFLVALLWA